jgi:CDP-paratose 2-epimerase
MWFPDNPNWDWLDKWEGWAAKVEYVRSHSGGRPIWVTETGIATWDLATHQEAKHELQADILGEAAAAPAERLYWYSLIDLDPAREAIEGFHVDENEYHMGLVKDDGTRKPAFEVMKHLMGAADGGRAPSLLSQAEGPR